MKNRLIFICSFMTIFIISQFFSADLFAESQIKKDSKKRALETIIFAIENSISYGALLIEPVVIIDRDRFIQPISFDVEEDNLNIQPLLVQGGPGTGKTALALFLAKITGLKYYRFQCYPGVVAKDVLYWWNERLQDLLTKTAYESGNINISEIKRLIYRDDCRIDGVFAKALLDPVPSIIHLDEIDKVEPKFEAALLQVTSEAKITVSEIDQDIVPVSGVRPRIIFTSNAGVHGMRISLSQPLLRRRKFIKLHKPALIRQYMVLRQKFPDLPEQLVRECVIFGYQVDDFVKMDKPLDLSEVINWMESLRQSGTTRLTWESVMANIGDLTKMDLDKENLIDSISKIFHFIKENSHMSIAELSDRVEVNITSIDAWKKKKGIA